MKPEILVIVSLQTLLDLHLMTVHLD